MWCTCKLCKEKESPDASTSVNVKYFVIPSEVFDLIASFGFSDLSLQGQQQRAQHEQQMEQEERIAREMQEMKLSELRVEKMKQQIRQNSLELRELEAQLKAGYMNRERAAQIAEKQAAKDEKTVSSWI